MIKTHITQTLIVKYSKMLYADMKKANIGLETNYRGSALEITNGKTYLLTSSKKCNHSAIFSKFVFV